MSKKRLVIGVVVAASLAGGGVLASRSHEKKASEKDEAASPFRIGRTQTEDLQVSVREVGIVDPVTKVDVKSTVSGRVTSLKVRDGAVVNVGDLLAEVEPDVTQAQSLSEVRSSLTEMELKLKDAERELATQKALFDNGLIGSEALRNATVKKDLAAQALEAAKARYRIVEDRGIPIGAAADQHARVTSPMKGVVIKKGVELGETVSSGVSSFNAGTVLFTVADLRSLIVRVNLNEVDIAKVHVGQPCRITLDAYPQKIFTGTVRFVAPAAKVVEKIKVFEVEVGLDELTDAFRTGMSANVEILGDRREKVLSVPLEALQRKDGATVVFRLKPGLAPEKIEKAREGLTGRTKFIWLSENWKDYFDSVPVKAGIATLERVEIASGLAAGDQVCLEDPTKKKVEKDDDN